jgi:integrase
LKIAEHGVEKSLMFQSLDEAEAVKADLLQQHSATLRRTVGEVFDEWLAWCVESRGIKPATVYCYVQISRRLPSSMQIGRMTESEARKLYQTQVDWVSPRTKKPASAATHHLFLRVVKNLWRWAIERGYCPVNPWSKIAPVGRRAVGKLQLRIDEARRFEAVALKQARRGDVPALGALLMIYLGLRQGEVVDRVARDIDDNGRVLWIPSGKTKNARRRLKIPEHLRHWFCQSPKTKSPTSFCSIRRTIGIADGSTT